MRPKHSIEGRNKKVGGTKMNAISELKAIFKNSNKSETQHWTNIRSLHPLTFFGLTIQM